MRKQVKKKGKPTTSYAESKAKVKKPSAKRYEELTGQGLGSLTGQSTSIVNNTSSEPRTINKQRG